LDFNCIILAGGKSSRLGRNKLFVKVGSLNLLERVINRLVDFNNNIYIVVAEYSDLPDLTGYPRIKIVKDIVPGKGSLGGLYTGLTASNTAYNLVSACDMPFINLDLFRYLISQAESYDAIVPVINNIAEPLYAVYSRKCIAPIQFLIEQNRLSILELFPMINVNYINTDRIDDFDSRHLSFFNINSESDLKIGREIAEKEDMDCD
jgi:molybdenum cofactor guanylyltransferase